MFAPELPASAHAQPMRLAAGATLFRPGDPCEGFLVVGSGTVRVSLSAANGREIVLYRVEPGQICLQTFGCLAQGRDYSAEGVAETALEGALIPAANFMHLVAEDAGFRARVFDAVARRFMDFERLVEDLALSGFGARLARALLRRAGPDGIVRLTHEELAVEIGSGRAVVSRQLGVFARDRLVRLERGRIALVDRDGLGAIASADA